MKSALVVSTGRTGTEAVARNFSKRYRDAVALHEPFGSRVLRIVGNLYAAGVVGNRLARIAVRMTYGFRRRRFSDSVYIESNPQLALLIPIICREYPDTLIVHLIRKPDDFARSYINHGAFSGLKGWLSKKLPFWFLRPEHLSRSDWPNWNAMSPIDACIWRWSIMNEIIERDSERYAAHYVRLLYEDLFSNRRDWEVLSEMCGLDPSVWRDESEILRTNRSQPVHSHTPGRMFTLDSAAAMSSVADQMARYGYGNGPN